ncbi:oligosaccharide flippase family protein [Fulvivirga sp. M361]|nr:oligosaccharide flippase family protein [Fulvivirga sp. M361]
MLNYLLVPYYTKVFDTAEYGIVTEFYAYAAFFNVIYTYGLETAYFRYASINRNNEASIYSTATSSIFITSIGLSVCLSLFATPIVTLLQYPGKEYYVYWLSAIFALDAIVAIPFAKLRIENKAKLFAIARLVNIMVNIGLNLFFISFCSSVFKGDYLPTLKPWIEKIYNPGFGVEYVFLSNLIANALFLILLWRPLSQLRLRIKWHLLKPMLRYGYPILFTGLAYATNEMLSRGALKYWLTPNVYSGFTNMEVLGIFGAVYKLSIFMTLGIQAFRYAAEPFFFSQAGNKQSPQLFSKVMHWFIVFGCFIFLAISLNLDILKYLLRNPDYRMGIDVVPMLLMANLFYGIYYNLSVWYKLTDKTYYGTWITIVGAITTITLNYLVIPVYGFHGSAFVTLISFALMTVISYLAGKRHYPIPYKTLSGLGYITVTSIIAYLLLTIQIENFVLSKTLHFIVIISFALVVLRLEKDNLPAKTT